MDAIESIFKISGTIIAPFIFYRTLYTDFKKRFVDYKKLGVGIFLLTNDECDYDTLEIWGKDLNGEI